ncbi:MAG: hypothetical protein R3F65_00200 [bacterium]
MRAWHSGFEVDAIAGGGGEAGEVGGHDGAGFGVGFGVGRYSKMVCQGPE